MITLVSTRKLDEDEVKEIKFKFDIGQDEQVTFEIDESLIAGIVLKKENQLYDGSVKGQLEKLKQNLYKRVL